MLHIVNGDSFATKLRKAVPDADILVWRESLYEGPLSVSFTDPKTREARARYFTDLGVPAGQFEHFTSEQEQKLEGFRAYSQIVLWFEHDLYDQAMLIYLLQWFARHNLEKVRLLLICIDSFPGIEPFRGLGSLTPQQILTLMGTWEEVTGEQLELAVRAWNVYAGDNPAELFEFIRGDTAGLPFLKRALECHLKRLPSLHNGLSAVLESALIGIRYGIDSPAALFLKISDQWLDYGLGDVQFWRELNDAARCEKPLIVRRGGALPGFGNDNTGASVKEIRLSLTPFGETVLAGKADQVAVNGICTWFGGLFLSGKGPVWRWNKELGTAVYK
ncbi:DUF1835 domain-containing protein [Paenibacillus caseinilyticus]|uniref:RNA polymerase sigma24 factor n=1 Tax=Paenibacillus mucilaginosus K02 TaxID=997761 RepID=I0BA93_9BACL|nr:DUF1835 domain-containing protein [Paenibacillus mucilaginosus]AFH59290.1 RNA polymerase sigma24 factor [Paenibacillus mucilaginosus K02]